MYYCHLIYNSNAWSKCPGNMVAMWLLTAMHRVLARQYGCHVITYCNAQSTGQAIWLPCDYLLQCTEYWPGNMVAMWLLPAVHRVLARQYGCHVITYCSAQSTGQAIWLPCDYLLQCIGYWPGGMVAMWLFTAMHRVMARQYGCHVITYCNAQSIGQAIWFPCDYLLQCAEYWPGNMIAMWLVTAMHRVLARRYGCHVITYCNA